MLCKQGLSWPLFAISRIAEISQSSIAISNGRLRGRHKICNKPTPGLLCVCMYYACVCEYLPVCIYVNTVAIYACMYTMYYAYMFAWIHACIYTRNVRVYVYVCMHVCMCVCMCICMDVRTCVFVHHVGAPMCIHACEYVYMMLCIPNMSCMWIVVHVCMSVRSLCMNG